jgi:hypothetical protein
MTLSWPKSFNARANHPQHFKISQQSLAILRRPSPENGEMAAKPAVMPAI